MDEWYIQKIAKERQEEEAEAQDSAETEAASALPADHAEHEKSVANKPRTPASNLWLVIFADLAALMLTFFVLVFSTKEVDPEKLQPLMKQTIPQAMHSSPDQKKAAGDIDKSNIARVAYGEALNLDYLQGVLKTSLGEAGLEDRVRLSHGPDHLKLIPEGNVFAGAGVLSEAGAKTARDLAGRLRLLSNRVTVAGRGPGWETALAAGTAFAAELREGGYGKSVTVIGETGGGAGIEIRVEADSGRVR